MWSDISAVCSGQLFSYLRVEANVTEMNWVKKQRSEEFVKIESRVKEFRGLEVQYRAFNLQTPN